jgi:tungstate transport system substrate-binding protein
MRKMYITIFALLIIALLPCVSSAGEGFVLMASTIGPIDSGIVGVLEDQFEKDSGIRVRHVGAGTGAALDLAKSGQIDLVLVHAKSLEEKFVKDGFGTERIPLMYNDFVIVGPVEDPAEIKGIKSAADAMQRISGKGAIFISRGDNSGTHIAEKDLWAIAGIKPAGSWYVVYEKGSLGNVPTLEFTDQKGAYTVMDRATYLALKNRINLTILVEGDEALLNFISLIPVNRKKFTGVNHWDAMTFARWLTAPDKGQKIIADFGRDKYGFPLFFPNSDAWKKSRSVNRP